MSQDLGLRHRNSKVKMYEITLLTSLRQLASHYLLSKKLEKQCEAEEPPLPAGQFRLLMNLCVERTSNSGKSPLSLFIYFFFFLAGMCLKLLQTLLPDCFRFHPVSPFWKEDLRPVFQWGWVPAWPLAFSSPFPTVALLHIQCGQFQLSSFFPQLGITRLYDMRALPRKGSHRHFPLSCFIDGMC